MTLPCSNTATTHSPEDILAKYLEAQSLTTGYTIRINGGTSETPNKQLVLTGDGPVGASEYLTGGTVAGGAVQIRVRGNPDDQRGPRNAILAIFHNVDTLKNVAVAFDSQTYTIHAVHILIGPVFLQTDEQRRWEWVLNVKTDITQLT